MQLRHTTHAYPTSVYGLAIYAVNLQGLTAIFPWFSVLRGWVTMLVHVVFGITLAGACRFLGSAEGGWRSPSDN
jgi:acyl-coenzyme A synthetase/AMP-(fatty) acid ligase